MDAKRHSHELRAPLHVSVAYADGMYTGVCDDLGIVTEHATLDGLRRRVRLLVPEMVALNQPSLEARHVRLRFDVEDSDAHIHRA